MRKDALRSTRSSSRARRSSQHGYALISALVLAILYFGLIELLLLDSARELAEARRFRARIIAETLAENGAELAALQIVTTEKSEGSAEDWQGTLTGRMTKDSTSGVFDIVGEGKSGGITESKAKVVLRGRVVVIPNVAQAQVRINWSTHTY